MSEESDLVPSIVALNGGTLVGKTRLQKTVYLLRRCGVEADADFEYHNFGPYSAKLAFLCDLAKAQGKITTEERPGFHDVPYTVFVTKVCIPADVGGKSPDFVTARLEKMKRFNAVELELAATLDFLRLEGIPNEMLDEAVAELKPIKSSKDRLARAHVLLSELEL